MKYELRFTLRNISDKSQRHPFRIPIDLIESPERSDGIVLPDGTISLTVRDRAIGTDRIVLMCEDVEAYSLTDYETKFNYYLKFTQPTEPEVFDPHSKLDPKKAHMTGNHAPVMDEDLEKPLRDKVNKAVYDNQPSQLSLADAVLPKQKKPRTSSKKKKTTSKDKS